MDNTKIEIYQYVLKPGEVYLDRKYNQLVEFKYLGQTGYAIVCEPGDSGGGMQSSWGTDAENLEEIVNDPQ